MNQSIVKTEEKSETIKKTSIKYFSSNKDLFNLLYSNPFKIISSFETLHIFLSLLSTTTTKKNKENVFFFFEIGHCPKQIHFI